MMSNKVAYIAFNFDGTQLGFMAAALTVIRSYLEENPHGPLNSVMFEEGTNTLGVTHVDAQVVVDGETIEHSVPVEYYPGVDKYYEDELGPHQAVLNVASPFESKSFG